MSRVVKFAITQPISVWPNPNRDRRMHWAKQRTRERTIRTHAHIAAKNIYNTTGPLLSPVTITLEIGFPDKRQRDLENWSSKGLIDGIVDSGLLQNDSSQHVTKTIRIQGPPSPKGTITMTIHIEEADH